MADAVQWLHDLPRPVGTNQFPTTLSGTAFTEYLTGVGSVSGGLIAVGVILGIALVLLYALAFCRCCCFGPCSKRELGPCRIVLYIAVLVLGGAACLCAFISAGPASAMGAALTDVTTGIDGLVKASGTVGGSANTLSTSATTLAQSSRSLAARLRSKPPPAIDTSGLDALATAADSASTSLGSSFSGLTSLTDGLGPVSTTLTSQEAVVGVVPLAEAAVFGALILLFLVTLLPMRLCSCLHCVVSPAMSGFVMIIWIVCGVLMIVAVVAADLCVDFKTTMVAVVRNDPSLAAIAPSASYYLQCDTMPAMSTNGTFYGFADAGVTTLNQSSADVARLDDIKQHPAVTPADDAAIDQVQADFAQLVTSAVGVRTSLSCSALNTPLNGIITPMCGKFLTDGFVPYWGLQLACAVLLALVLVINVNFCIRHPSIKSDGDGPQSKAGEVEMKNAAARAGP